MQSHLEAEGIDSFMQNATGGDILSIYGFNTSPIKLQVSEHDAERAQEIMQTHGFVENLGSGTEQAPPMKNFTQNIPFLKNLPPAIGFVIGAAVIITVVVTLLYFLFLSE